MARPKTVTVNDNAEILSYALLHLEKERDGILAKIAHIKQQLGTGSAPVGRPRKVVAPAPAAAPVEAPAATAGKTRKPRVLSPAARKRISMAQKKRWAASRKESE